MGRLGEKGARSGATLAGNLLTGATSLLYGGTFPDGILSVTRALATSCDFMAPRPLMMASLSDDREEFSDGTPGETSTDEARI